MKINSFTIRKIIKKELSSVLKEFKELEILPTPESLGFQTIKIPSSIKAQAKNFLDILDVEGLIGFIKKNIPPGSLKETTEKQFQIIPSRSAFDLIQENIQIIHANRTWQRNFEDNIKELILISKKDSSQKEMINEWVNIFIVEASKTWFDRNMPTIKGFVEEKIETLATFLNDVDQEITIKHRNIADELHRLFNIFVGCSIFIDKLSDSIHAGVHHSAPELTMTMGLFTIIMVSYFTWENQKYQGLHNKPHIDNLTSLERLAQIDNPNSKPLIKKPGIDDEQ